jgi:hypothetical protein
MHILLALLAFFCIVHTQPAAAQTHDIFFCESQDATRNCTGCKKSDLSATFRLNSSSTAVLVTFFQDKKPIGVESYERCNIVDEKNWFCSKGTVSISVCEAVG